VKRQPAKERSTAQLLSKTYYLNEALMEKRQAIEAVDRILQDIMNCSLPFGGNLIVFGGDFCLVLPAAPNKSRDDHIFTSVVKSYVWHILEKIQQQHHLPV